MLDPSSTLPRMLFDAPTVILFCFLGLFLGSFGNVLIWRLPRDESIGGRSHCPHCGHVLNVRDLLPVISFVILRGRCRYCSKAIALRYPLVELTSMVLFFLALVVSITIVQAVLLGLALWFLILIAVIDAETQGIPDSLNIPLVAVVLMYVFLTGSFMLLAPIIAGGFFFVQWAVSGGKWTGSGDIILAAGIGVLLGSTAKVIVMLMVAYIFGSLVASVLLIMKKKTRTDYLAFAPFLVLSTYITLIWGEKILAVWL